MPLMRLTMLIYESISATCLYTFNNKMLTVWIISQSFLSFIRLRLSMIVKNPIKYPLLNKMYASFAMVISIFMMQYIIIIELIPHFSFNRDFRFLKVWWTRFIMEQINNYYFYIAYFLDICLKIYLHYRLRIKTIHKKIWNDQDSHLKYFFHTRKALSGNNERRFI